MHVERREKNTHPSHRTAEIDSSFLTSAMLTTRPSAGDTTRFSPEGILRSGSRKKAAMASVNKPKIVRGDSPSPHETNYGQTGGGENEWKPFVRNTHPVPTSSINFIDDCHSLSSCSYRRADFALAMASWREARRRLFPKDGCRLFAQLREIGQAAFIFVDPFLGKFAGLDVLENLLAWLGALLDR